MQEGNDNQRIDGRPQSSWATQAGLRGVHRDMRGNVIGGFTEDGQGWGNKADRGAPNAGTGWQARMNRSSNGNGTTAANSNYVAPATGNILNGRQNLFKEMTAAGSAGLTPAMRAKAQSLGVTDDAFNAAAGRLKTNEAVTPSRPAPNPGATPPGPDPGPGTTPPGPPPRPKAPDPVSKINGIAAADAIAKARPGAEQAWQGKVGARPQFGSDIAKNNIATMGQAGAVADYFARSRADNNRPLMAAVKPVNASANSPMPTAAKPSWQQSFKPFKSPATVAAEVADAKALKKYETL
jgi:hypothetical protein